MDDPPVYDLVDRLYHSVMDGMPKKLQERAKLSAFVLAGSGSALLVNSLQWTSEHLVDKIIPGFDNYALPPLEMTCLVGIHLLPLAYAMVKPEKIIDILDNHLVYASGMLGVYFGSTIAALQDFF